MTNPTLEPCPFCGSNAELHDPNRRGGQRPAMTCPRYPVCNECGIGFSFNTRSESLIIKKFNTRAAAKELAAQILKRAKERPLLMHWRLEGGFDGKFKPVGETEPRQIIYLDDLEKIIKEVTGE